jgi:hypothetical protein
MLMRKRAIGFRVALHCEGVGTPRVDWSVMSFMSNVHTCRDEPNHNLLGKISNPSSRDMAVTLECPCFWYTSATPRHPSGRATR